MVYKNSPGMKGGICMENDVLPQYMRIAASVASRIAMGEFREGQRISGRSVLSSEYGVSPETVRKALRVLADLGVVSVREGSGTVVVSSEKAGQ
jgi:DNA-binding GntR family transcriptional regulator